MEIKTIQSQKIIQNFLRYLISKGVSSSSLKYYKSDISNFLFWASDRKIDNKLVHEYINSQRLSTPLSTLNRRLSTLRSYASFIGQDFMSGVENVTGFRKVARSWQEALLGRLEHKPNLKNLISKILFNRPNWYKKYHSFALANYIHIAILILFSSLLGYAVYDQVFYSTDRSLAFPTALIRPNRYLSFQGRLTDNLGNPKTISTNMVFKLYSVSSGGAALWNSGTCSITPDQDGIFSTLLGSSCGTEITSSVFSENAAIWLGVTVGADVEATPRIQIATVAYALNSETLQGFPLGTGTSTIPYIDSTGTVVLASSSPKIQSTSGTFAVEGVALTLSTPNTSNGVVTINPDGTGTLNLAFEGATAGGGVNGFLNATNANITSGALYGGTVASNATGYNFINFLSGAVPASVFSVQNDGDIITSGNITVGGTSSLAYSRFGTGTTGHGGNITNTSDLLISSDLELDGNLYLDGGTIANSAGTASIILSSSVTNTPNTLSASNWLVENTANVGQAALMINNTKSGDLLTASASGVTKFTVQNDGDVVLSNQLQLGNLASNPTALGAGAMYFNTTTNTNQCYNGTSWFNCGGTLYSNTNASVADGSYITVTHNLATNDLLSSAWISAQGLWKELDSSYKPAIAWEGKDTQKGVYHNSVNEYISTNETSLTSTALNTGLLYDTFEDSIKTDSANTTVSVSTDMGDNGSANYITLDQRVQEGRVGLMGSQTYNTATNDNDGQAYLGSNTVNDIFYYDRSKDSVPEVLVELGIDPNWYNGVTLSVATSSASYSQAGTLADKNPNLTTSYNGSLIKATGTDTTPRTIYITIKSPTTFDWTNYQGDSATGVTITPGTAQALGSTGVSATFTAANYNTGDVFKIASWYIEAEGTTRGTKQQFPERSIVIAQGTAGTGYIDVIDADTQKLWMRFTEGTGYYVRATSNRVPVTTTMLNGKLYFGMNDSGVANAGVMERVNFDTDSLTLWTTAGKFAYDQSISLRNSTSNLVTLGAGEAIVVNHPNDITATVIPNQPTQEITVSGWGYIPHDGVSVAIGETINLPFTFNNKPSVVANFAGLTSSGVTPTSLSNCNANSGLNGTVGAITERTISINIRHNDNTTVIGSSFNSCYTWTATGIVSPKQFVATATGATTTDGGTTIINETDGTKSDLLVGSQNANVIWQTKIAFSKNNELYVSVDDSTANTTYIGTYYGVHGLASEPTWAQYRNGYYRIGTKSDGWAASGPTILGSATGTSQVQSLYATNNTSTIVPNSNTIYVGTASGVSVINEKQGFGNVFDSSVEYSGSVKYYTKDYVSEEMIGDIRGMWPLNNANASSDFEDVSIKAGTLTGTNITANGDSITGVRGTGTDFDGSSEYLSIADNANLSLTGSASYGAWVKLDATTDNQQIIIKRHSATNFPSLMAGRDTTTGYGTTGQWNFSNAPTACGVATTAVGFDTNWHFLVGTYDGTNQKLYVDGQLAATDACTTAVDTDGEFQIGAGRYNLSAANYANGTIDEVFVTAAALTETQIRYMYQVGYRALQSHGTGLGGGAADSNQQLGYTSTGTSSVGVVAVDDDNQYMYVGTNSTTLGGLSKIQLNSDTNIKTYNSSANVPTGGTLLIDEDVTSLAVGETLYAAGSAASGVKSMGVDNNSTATSGNFVSKTYTLPKNIGSAVLWVSGVTDASDGSNTLTVKASNDGGSNYATCTLVNTNSNPAVPEKEYACTFSTADNDLKVKFEFVRGSTKTNTYVVQYGISWLGETGFRVEQTDTNNVRLYNFSGETQNLKLNVTGASTTQLANPWTDGGSYLYPTGYEALRIYDGAGTNYLGLSHDGTLANLTYNGSTVLSINSTGDLLPNTDDTQSLGSSTKRWKDVFVGPATVHIGTSTTDEGTLSYDTTGNILNFGTDSTTNGDIAFFTDDLYLDKSTGYVGIGDATPDYMFDVAGTAGFDSTLTLTGSAANIALGSNYLSGDGGDEGIYIDSTGNVGIGTNNPGVPLMIRTSTTSVPIRIYNDNVDSTEYWSVGPAASDNFVIFNESSTGQYMAHGATTWTANSDERLKTNISQLSDVEGLSALMQLTPVNFNWKDVNASQELQTGFIAQEVQSIFPNLVELGQTTTITLDDGTTQTIETPLGVSYTGFIPYIIKGIQQQQAQINSILQSGIASVQGIVSPKVETNIISPIADSNLIIDLDPNDNNSPSKLAIKGINDEEVASIDASGNAAFDGTITSQDLSLNNDATISGTLYADNIESKRIEDIENLLQEVEANQSLLAQATTWNTNTATESANLEGVFETITTNQLFVTEQIAATSLFVSDNFTTKNINSLDSALQIQSLAASPLEIMAGKIIVDTNGDTKFMGNVEIAGNLTVNNIIVANNIDPIATESATIVEGEINSNSTAGKALLAADTDVIRINNNKVSQNTLIYITPITSTQNKVLYVKAKGEGYFEVGFSDTLDTDVEFNWWIIELANIEEPNIQSQ